MSGDVDLLTISLIGWSLGALVVAGYVARRLGRWMNFRSLLIVNVVFVNILSGVAHLADVRYEPRGFFDVLATDGGTLDGALIGNSLALFAVCAGALHGLSTSKLSATPAPDRDPEEWLLPAERRFLLLLVAALVVTAIPAAQRMSAYASTIDATRLLTVDPGMARYSFMSNWVTWLASFAAVLAAFRLRRLPLAVLAIGGAAVVAIAGSLAWSGGRSIVIVMCLPIGLVLLRRAKSYQWLAAPTAALALYTYTSSLSAERAASGGGGGTVSWIDWQWGRFSMMGYAYERVGDYGYLWGETFLSGLLGTVYSSLQFLGFEVTAPGIQNASQVASADLLHSLELTYVVPGFAAELYLNFGYIGVVAGFYLLARITNWVDRRFAAAPGAILELFWAYLGTLLVFRTVAAESGAIWSYLAYSGTPLIAAAFYSTWARRTSHRRAGGVVPGRGPVRPARSVNGRVPVRGAGLNTRR